MVDLPSDQRLEKLFDEHHGFVTRSQVVEAGLHPRVLGRWVQAERAERLQRGVYRKVGADPVTHEALLEVQLRVPHAVVCLISALNFHGLTTTWPPEIYVAIPRNRADPRLAYPPTRVFYYPPAMYAFGVQKHPVAGRDIAVYGPEKTLADLLRHQATVGLDLFYEGIKRYIARPRPQRPDYPLLLEAARVCRVEPQMRASLELLAHDIST